MRVVRQKSPMAPTDYAMLDKPTVQRQRAVGDGLRSESRFGGFARYTGVLAPASGLVQRIVEIPGFGARCKARGGIGPEIVPGRSGAVRDAGV
jgi:hypothetical protein